MSRAEELRSATGLSACLLTSAHNIRYVTGFTGTDSEVVVTENRVCLFTDSRYAQQALTETADFGTEVLITDTPGRLPAIRDVLQETPGVLGIEEEHLSIGLFKRIRDVVCAQEYADISKTLLSMRAVKSPEELACIRTAAQATDDVMQVLAEYIAPGMTEYEVYAKILYETASRCMEPSFDPIVAAGTNGAMPHASVSEYVIRKGDLVTLDFGCRYNGYCADMTRTLAVGHVDGELKTIYDVVEQAQKIASEAAKIGIPAAKVDEAARQYIEKAGYAENFGHGTGHGVGLQIHELPVINKSSRAVISEGMVFTIEPGIYIPGLGGVRIEDTCAAGIGSLFQFPKRLLELQ